MAILSQTSTNLMLSLKIVLISTSVLGAAVMLKVSFPAITDFAVYDVPSIYNVVVSWLRPPYLYLVINCIIITIVASSKLQSKKHDLSPSPPTAPLDTMVHLQPQPEVPIVKNIQTDYNLAAEYNYNDVVLSNNNGYEVELGKGLEFDSYLHSDASIIGNETAFTASIVAPVAAVFKEDVMSNKENECVISKSTWMPPANEDSAEFYTPNEKPPASARFGHRKNIKASPEGGKSLLGVSKVKRHDTLESTWKTITEGRAMPLTRHLRKSDTWERDNHHSHGSRHHQQQQQLEKTPEKMTKAETFNDRKNATSPLMTPSPGGGGLGKLKKEPSLGQDELNKRVEAFIKKFNEDMRLQRQESLNQYMEMINRGAH
ncbi:Protein of unknown function (DUF761) [Abeliophyllum distichum]|uniref:DUF4408 domain-containing protein n=1 Tax=Abeliophyllum distichum TaxID=126358 RepID=A0ABD1QIS5_9LAMI